MPIIQTAERD